jgi:hypothetical protein
LAIRGDEELDTLIKATIAGGGVIPHIHKVCLLIVDFKDLILFFVSLVPYWKENTSSRCFTSSRR